MNYTNITLDEMKTVLIDQWQESTGSSATHEYVFEKFVNKNPKIIVMVYTSISKQNDCGRKKGQDAIRVCAVNLTDKIGWIKTIKVLRVTGWRNNLLHAIDNVINQSRYRLQRNHQIWNQTTIGTHPRIYETNVSLLNFAKKVLKRNVCPCCGDFYISKDLVKIEKQNEKVESWQFQCPHCLSTLIIDNI